MQVLLGRAAQGIEPFAQRAPLRIVEVREDLLAVGIGQTRALAPASARRTAWAS